MESAPPNPPARRPPAWLLALGAEGLPISLTVDSRTWRLTHTFKHDFFAATGLYEESSSDSPGHAERSSALASSPSCLRASVPSCLSASPTLAVAKFGRTRRIGPLPLRWIGRFLTRRESDHYLRLADLDGVPAHLGRIADVGFLHAFIPGRPLQRHQPVPDDFFPRLRALLDALHARHMAYVDLQKRENILLGDDGRPWLIDFQISLYAPPGPLGPLSPRRWLLRRFQSGDNYHLLKHWRRHRPDQLSDADLARSWRKPFYVHLHNWITRPFTLIRRGVLRKLDPDRVRGI